MLYVMATQESDEELMRQFCAHDEAAFERLFLRHKDALYRYLSRQCRHPQVAEELFQDTWLNLVKAKSQYKLDARFLPYLFRIAHNRLIDYYRVSAKETLLLYEQDPETLEAQLSCPSALPEEKVAIRQDLDCLFAVLWDLPEPQREAFLLKEESGMSLEEIAHATGVGRETVKSRLRYAMKRLRNELRVSSCES